MAKNRKNFITTSTKYSRQRSQDYLDQMSLVRLMICIVCERSRFVDAIAHEQAKQIRDMFVQSNDFVQHVIDVHSEQTAVPVINRIKVYQFMLTQFSDDREVTKRYSFKHCRQKT